GDTPEPVRVAADAVDDQERHAVLVLDPFRLHHANRLLDLVASREIRTEGAMHGGDVTGLDVIDVVVAWPPDAPLDDLELPAIDLPGGEDEADQLVGRLGPAIPVVGARRHLGLGHLHAPRPDEALVVIGRVVRARHHDPAHALLERRPVDVVGERHVLVLRPELRVAVVLPRRGVQARRPHVPAVDDGVGAAEVLTVRVSIGLGQIRDDQAGHGLAGGRGRAHVDRYQVPALTELLEHALGDVAGRSGQDHASPGHGAAYIHFRSSRRPICRRWTSSGPSAKRSVREWAHQKASGKAWLTPPPPCNCMARSTTRSVMFGTSTLISAIACLAALLPTLSIIQPALSTSPPAS